MPRPVTRSLCICICICIRQPSLPSPAIIIQSKYRRQQQEEDAKERCSTVSLSQTPAKHALCCFFTVFLIFFSLLKCPRRVVLLPIDQLEPLLGGLCSLRHPAGFSSTAAARLGSILLSCRCVFALGAHRRRGVRGFCEIVKVSLACADSQLV